MTLGAQHGPKMLYEYSLLKRSLSQQPFCENKIYMPIVKYIWKCKGTRIAKIILEKNRVARLALSNFESYCKAAVINTLYCWHKDKHKSVEQNRLYEQALTHIVSF